MPKNIVIHKDEVRHPNTIESASIPANTYKSNFYHELEYYGRERLRKVYYDMLLIRAFEEMLDSIKTTEEYQGRSYVHLGPAHLSIGQESAAVGQCLVLEREDFIFGSHRSHGEIIAKCLSALRLLSEDDLLSMMEQYRDGSILRVIERNVKLHSIYDIAEYYVLYGLLAEIFARETGFNAGLGGSMHAFFVPLGSMPNNAIVGGSADIALGAALYKKIQKKPGIVIANIGDAAMACGPVWEALVFSSMDQYRSLWDDYEGAPPYLLNVFNNFYGMGGQTYGETMGMGSIARIAAGVNAQSLHAERVDGFNPLAVADAILRKKELLLAGRGPVMLDTITYRVSGHSPSDASSYRTKEEVEAFRNDDPIDEYKNYLITHNIFTEEIAKSFIEDTTTLLARVFDLVVDSDVSPMLQAGSIEKRMFTRRQVPMEPAKDLLIPMEKNPRLLRLKEKKRYLYNEEGKPYPASRVYTMRDAVFESVLYAAYHDPALIIYGEENRGWGGAFACYRGLDDSLPPHRLFNSPISEGAIVGTAVGYALSGGRALVELMYCDFLGRAGDEVFNQMPKWQSMSASVLSMPMVLRVSVGNKYGAQHSQDWTSLVAHIPGLQVMYPATPYDAKGMLALALSSSDPVVFFESQKLYGVGEYFHKEGVPTEYYTIELGQPVRRRSGGNLSIFTLGPPLYEALKAADYLSKTHSLEVDLIDLRFVNPLDYDLLLESVRKTGKVLLVGDAVERGSFLHTVASTINAAAFDMLDAPPIVLGSKNWICPPAELEKEYFPTMTTILDTIHQRLVPLAGHTSQSIQTQAEYIRAHRLGV